MERRIEPQEEQELRAALERGESPSCPRCGSVLATEHLPSRADVAYVRHRVLLQCSSCPFKVVVDRK